MEDPKNSVSTPSYIIKNAKYSLFPAFVEMLHFCVYWVSLGGLDCRIPLLEPWDIVFPTIYRLIINIFMSGCSFACSVITTTLLHTKCLACSTWMGVCMEFACYSLWVLISSHSPQTEGRFLLLTTTFTNTLSQLKVLEYFQKQKWRNGSSDLHWTSQVALRTWLFLTVRDHCPQLTVKTLTCCWQTFDGAVT